MKRLDGMTPEMRERYELIRSRLYADAVAGEDSYCAVVRVDGPYGTGISNCQHRHRTRETAERCAEKIKRDISDPRAGYPTPRWTA